MGAELMQVRILLGQRKVSYPGEYAPEVMTAWDEYCLADNWGGWEFEKANRIAEWGDDIDSSVEIVVELDDDDIDKAFETAKVRATILEEED
jgi:hypothetical protein